jgi:hypothetical protein
MRVTAAISSLLVFAATTSATTYYVAPNGQDGTGRGTTISTPFKTIQAAASIMVASDICYVRQGTYRETVTPANSGTAGNPIGYKAYQGETVTIDGCDTISASGWTVHSGNIYKHTGVPGTLTADRQQAFVNDSLVDLARWPNGSSVWNSSWSSVQSSGAVGDNFNAYVIDPAIPGGTDFWKGGILIGKSYGWWSTRGWNIGSYDASAHKLIINNPDVGTWGGSGVWIIPNYPNGGAGTNEFTFDDGYYLTGILAALDANNEFYHGITDSIFYLQAPNGDSPSGYRVKYKSRISGFDFGTKSYINLEKINFFACKIDAGNAQHVTIDGITGSNMTSKRVYPAEAAVELGGKYNALKNSTMQYISDNGINLFGTSNSVVNNLIHDVQYLVADCGDAGIKISGEKHLVSHNTIYNTGRAAVSGSFTQCIIQYNNLYKFMKFSADGGGFYTSNTDFENSEFHHNWIHDNCTTTNHFMVGLYLDNGDQNAIVYDNLITNITGYAFHLGLPSEYNMLYNNTVYNCAASGYVADNIDISWAPDPNYNTTYNCLVINNIAHNTNMQSSVLFTNNLGAVDPLYGSPGSNDFTLQPTSQCIGTALPLTGITSGAIPDMGAFPYGQPAWSAGHNFTNPPNPQYTLNAAIKYKNLVANSSFEYGLTGWTKYGGQSAKTVGRSYGQFGNSCLQLGSGADGFSQVVSGLSPNTIYWVTGWIGMGGSDGQVTLGIKDFGGVEKSVSSTKTGSLGRSGFRFRTGSLNTSATIYLYKASGSSVAYGDVLGISEERSPEAIRDGGFDSGVVNWGPMGATLTADATTQNSGSYSCKVSAKTGTWAGPTQYVLLQNGSTYNNSFAVKLASGSDNVMMIARVTVNGVDNYRTLCSGTANSSGFALMQGQFTFNESAPIEKAFIYFETKSSLADLYLDDVAVTRNDPNDLPVGTITHLDKLIQAPSAKVQMRTNCGKLRMTIDNLPKDGAVLRMYKLNGTEVREVHFSISHTVNIASLPPNGVYVYSLTSKESVLQKALFRVVR